MIGGLKYIRKGRKRPIRKVSRDEALNRLERIIDQQERKISDAFKQSIQNIQEVATIQAIADAIQRGDTQAAAELVSVDVTDNALQPMGAAISGAVLEGGKVAAENLPTVRGPRGNAVNFVFNATNPKLSQFAQDVSATRIKEVGEDVRQVVRDIIQRETTAGINPLDTARRVRQSVGLTARQERSVENFRRNLELAADGNNDAMRQARALELRDRRFSIKEGMTRDQIDKQVERFRQRYIDYRARTIGRTESIRAVNGASREFIASFVESGQIEERQVRRFWHTARDEKVRSSHRRIPSMNPKGVGLREPFRTPLGPLEYPGDGSGRAENVINCRCSVFDRVISAELVDEDMDFERRPIREADWRNTATSNTPSVRRAEARANPPESIIDRRKQEIRRRLSADTEQQKRSWLNSVRNNPPPDEEGRVRRLLDNWVRGSNRKTSIELKEAAKREFGYGGLAFNRRGFQPDEGLVRKSQDDLRQVYQRTQEEFARRGQTTVTLYRGLKTDVTIPGSASSWTTNRKIAESFNGGAVWQEQIPVEKILTGKGMPDWEDGPYGNQEEFIVLGGS